MCAGCRAFYGSGQRRSPAERRARLGRAASALPRVLVVARSGNRKLGRIPTTITSAETCPDACSLKGNGCSSEFHVLGHHWSKAPERGLEWDAFLDWVRELPDGQLWRHNEAGDLPGENNRLDVAGVGALAGAAKRTRGFTYTHKELRSEAARCVIADANMAGFTVNLSADDPRQADQRAALGVGPVASIVPFGTRTGDRTPGGRRIVICPAQTEAHLTCAACQLCASPYRLGIVGFFPHGQMAKQIARRLPVIQERRAA